MELVLSVYCHHLSLARVITTNICMIRNGLMTGVEYRDVHGGGKHNS